MTTTVKTEIFKDRANQFHSGKYGYRKFVYTGAMVKGTATCPIHGDFEVTPNNHLRGRGCPKCNASKGEIAIDNILQKHGVSFKPQFRMPETSEVLFYDFYLPEKKLLIEFHGGQHYKFTKYFHKTEEGFKRQLLRDSKKKALAKAWGYQYLCIKHTVFERLSKNEFEVLLLREIEAVGTQRLYAHFLI